MSICSLLAVPVQSQSMAPAASLRHSTHRPLRLSTFTSSSSIPYIKFALKFVYSEGNTSIHDGFLYELSSIISRLPKLNKLILSITGGRSSFTETGVRALKDSLCQVKQNLEVFLKLRYFLLNLNIMLKIKQGSAKI